jgi:hypothetical protein
VATEKTATAVSFLVDFSSASFPTKSPFLALLLARHLKAGGACSPGQAPAFCGGAGKTTETQGENFSRVFSGGTGNVEGRGAEAEGRRAARA